MAAPEDRKKAALSQIRALKASGQWNDDTKKGVLGYLKTGEVPPEPARESSGGVMDTASRVLDYAGGWTRTAAANNPAVLAARVLLGDEEVSDVLASAKDDAKRALVGKAPQTAEYLERAGVPEGGSLSDMLPGLYNATGEGWKLQKGGAVDPTARGAAGFVGDVLLDPSTYLSGGATVAAKGAGRGARVLNAGKNALRVVVNPVEAAGDLLRASGRTAYKSGLKSLDQVAGQFNKRAPSEILMERGIWGTNSSIADQAEKVASTLKGEADTIVGDASKRGARVNLDDAFSDVEQKIAELRSRDLPLDQATAGEVETNILNQFRPIRNTHAPGNVMSLEDAVRNKTAIRGELPKGFYDKLQTSELAGELTADAARGLQKGVEEAVERTTGRGAELASKNADLGALLTTRKALENEVKKAANKNVFTSVDGLLTGFSNPYLLGAKKAADLGKTTVFRTGSGLLLNKVGKGVKKVAPLVEHGIPRRLLLEAMEEEAPPSMWQALIENSEAKGR